MPKATVFVLAGGKSTRMGTDKAFVDFGGTTLLEHMLRLARQASDIVRIVGQSDKFQTYAETVNDIYPDRGPLGGIHAALRSSNTDLNLMIAVDMPFMTPAFLRYLLQTASTATAMVTVPYVNGRFQPLCAVYRRSFADVAELSLIAGRNKIGLMLMPEITRVVSSEEIERLAFPLAMFDNLNTRVELDRARAELGQT